LRARALAVDGGRIALHLDAMLASFQLKLKVRDRLLKWMGHKGTARVDQM